MLHYPQFVLSKRRQRALIEEAETSLEGSDVVAVDNFIENQYNLVLG